MNNDGQLRAVHLILDYEPISRTFLDVGNSIRANDYRLARIDVSRPGFLAPYDLPLVDHPIPQGIPFSVQPLQQVPSARLLSRKELPPLFLLRRKLTDSDSKRKPSLYQRSKKEQTSIHVFRLLPR